MICHMKVHIVSYNLDQKKFSKSKIHILPNYEQTNLKTAIVYIGHTQFYDVPGSPSGLYCRGIDGLEGRSAACTLVSQQQAKHS